MIILFYNLSSDVAGLPAGSLGDLAGQALVFRLQKYYFSSYYHLPLEKFFPNSDFFYISVTNFAK